MFAISDNASTSTFRNEQIESLLGYARIIAVRMHKSMGLGVTRSIDVEDLIAEAYVALVRAVDAFDPTRGVPLRGFAGPRISGHLRHIVRDCDPKGRYNRQTLIRGERFISEFMALNEREPTWQEVEASVPGYAAAVQRSNQRAVLHLDEPNRTSLGHSFDGRSSGPEPTLVDAIPSSQPGPEDVVGARLDIENLLLATTALEPLERKVLLLRYRDGVSLRKIARSIGMSVVGAERLIERARKRVVDEVSGE